MEAFFGVVFEHRVEEMLNGLVASLVVGITLQVVENQKRMVGFAEFFGFGLYHLVLQVEVGEEGALGCVPKLVNGFVLAVCRGFRAQRAAHAMVEQVDVARLFGGAVGNQLVADLQYVDVGGLVEKVGMIDGELGLLVVDG